MSRREQQAHRVFEARHAVEISPLRGHEVSALLSQQKDQMCQEESSDDTAVYGPPPPLLQHGEQKLHPAVHSELLLQSDRQSSASSSPIRGAQQPSHHYQVVASSASPKMSSPRTSLDADSQLLSTDAQIRHQSSRSAATFLTPPVVVATETPVAARLVERPHGVAAESILRSSPVYQTHVATTISALERDITNLQQERLSLLAKLDTSAARISELESLVHELSETVHHQASQIQHTKEECRQVTAELEAAKQVAADHAASLRGRAHPATTTVRPVPSSRVSPTQRPPSPPRGPLLGVLKTEAAGAASIRTNPNPSASRHPSPSISRPTISSSRKSPAAAIEKQLAERQASALMIHGGSRVSSAANSRQPSPVPRRVVSAERRTQSPMEARHQLATTTFIRSTTSSLAKRVANVDGAAGPCRPRLQTSGSNGSSALMATMSHHPTKAPLENAAGEASSAPQPSPAVRPCVHRSTTVIMRNGVPIAGAGDLSGAPRTVTPGRDRVEAAIARMVAPRVTVGRFHGAAVE
mmetsp:Transcript_5574/g.6018  ORF Transcript_5574/g.6018 Transcript_5574/m.6018 type:complete len:527 (+) Transcript_5574:68-1648(+)